MTIVTLAPLLHLCVTVEQRKWPMGRCRQSQDALQSSAGFRQEAFDAI
jgi:hypothetical protein